MSARRTPRFRRSLDWTARIAKGAALTTILVAALHRATASLDIGTPLVAADAPHTQAADAESLRSADKYLAEDAPIVRASGSFGRCSAAVGASNADCRRNDRKRVCADRRFADRIPVRAGRARGTALGFRTPALRGSTDRRLERIAERAGIPLLFEAAQARGAVPPGRLIGNCGIASVFSFEHQKLLALGDGGMITTSDYRLFAALLRITQHPIRTLPQAIELGFPDAFDEVSLSFRMHGVAAAMGSALLPAIPDRIAHRQEVCEFLSERLRDLPGIRVSGAQRAGRSAFHTFAMTLVPSDLGDVHRDDVLELLRSRGIQVSAGPGRVPLHQRHRFRELSCIARQHSLTVACVSSRGAPMRCD